MLPFGQADFALVGGGGGGARKEKYWKYWRQIYTGWGEGAGVALSHGLTSYFPDLEKVWKIEIKSGKEW